MYTTIGNELDCVSFSVAKLLKEKGFDEPCNCLYREMRDGTIRLEITDTCDIVNRIYRPKWFVAPTFSQVQKWLEIKFNIWVAAVPYRPVIHFDPVWKYDITALLPPNLDQLVVEKSERSYGSERKALDEGLYRALKMIL